MAATIDWGEAFVKARYHIEGDGPLALDCYDVAGISAFVNTAHPPNVRAVADSLSQEPTTNRNFINYAKSCVKPAIDYWRRRFQTNLKAALKCAQIFAHKTRMKYS